MTEHRNQQMIFIRETSSTRTGMLMRVLNRQNGQYQRGRDTE